VHGGGFFHDRDSLAGQYSTSTRSPPTSSQRAFGNCSAKHALLQPLDAVEEFILGTWNLTTNLDTDIGLTLWEFAYSEYGCEQRFICYRVILPRILLLPLHSNSLFRMSAILVKAILLDF
jgi:hypothetical protein